jgi:1-acyl-sn-glycerol-3-phosphate acyltransferase
MRAPKLRATFPLTAPTWPAGVDRPPLERRTGIDYDTEWARRYPARLARALIVDHVLRPVVQVLGAPQLHGRDRIAGLEPPAIFAANHNSHLDTPLLLTALPDRFRHRAVVAAGADYFFPNRVTGAVSALAIGAFPIERLRVSRRSADLAADLLDEGWSLAIFPEGGRSQDGWAQPFRGGAAYLAQRTGLPVVPVHLEGTRRVLKRGARVPSPATVHVSFGSPLRAHPGEDARSFGPRIERAVATLADERATDWWTARRRAAARTTPTLTGPDAPSWRRAWALDEGRRARAGRRWPD